MKRVPVLRNVLQGSVCVSWLLLTFVACAPHSPSEEFEPPAAKTIPQTITLHGQTRIDNYYWLTDRENPDVMEYLQAENEYTERVMARTGALQAALFEEIRARTQETDMSVPERRGDYLYYERTVKGKEHPIYARKLGTIEAKEEIVLDVNELAPAEGFFAAGQLTVSPGQNILAFQSTDNGQYIGTIRFRNLDTGLLLHDEIQNLRGRPSTMAWGDNRTLFYLRNEPGTRHFHRLYRHTLGTNPADDVLVYEEPSASRDLWLQETPSRQYLIVSTYTDLRGDGWEHRYVEGDRPTRPPVLFLSRDWHVLMDVDCFRGYFYFLASDEGVNPRLVRAPVGQTAPANWEEVLPRRDGVDVEGFRIFTSHLVVEERVNGLRQFRIHPWSGAEDHHADFGDAAYVALFYGNPDPDGETFRYSFRSFTTPYSIYEYDMSSRKQVLVKRQDVPRFSPDDYISERLMVPGRGGVRIPVSLVYKRGVEKDGENPLLLTAYGAYGATTEATFSVPRLSLLDRGFIYAIAHVRGGRMLGREWHESGRLLTKKNTFTDFIDVAEYLIAERYANPRKLFAMGTSAGGTLMGAVANMRPDLFMGIVADVPAVDLLTPTRTGGDLRFSVDPDFGDPNVEDLYDYILSYSPYDNVGAKAYPHMLVTTAWNDSSVPYWGPAKWVAKMRALRTNHNLLLLQTDMEGGHSTDPERSQQWRDAAFRFAFLLDLAGVRQ